MHFSSVIETEAEDEVNHLKEEEEEEAKNEGISAWAKIPVLLTAGCVVLMWGEARFQWKHEINRKPGFQNWQGQEINQKRRTSVTLRRLCGAE